MTSAVSNPATQGPVNADARRRAAEPVALSALAFETLLHSVELFARNAELTQTRAAPAEMFEPAVVDPGSARLKELREGDRRSDASAPKGRPKEPVGEATPQSSVVAERSGLKEGASPRPPVDPRAMAAMQNSSGRDPQSAVRPSDTSMPWSTTDRAMPDAESRERMNRPPPSPKSMPLPANAAVLSPASHLHATPPPVARQVGEMLAAPRIAEATVGRAAAPAAPGSAPSDRSQSGPKAAASKAPDSTPPRPSDPTADAEATPFARLVRSIRLHVGERTSSARLQLHPPELGRMRVDVRLDGDQLALEVRTETHAARELVVQRVTELKTALEQHGIHVHRVDVAVAQPGAADPAAERLGSERKEPERRRLREGSAHDEDSKGLWDTPMLDVHA